MALTQVTPDVLHNIQSNVTQVGTLSNLSVAGNITANTGTIGALIISESQIGLGRIGSYPVDVFSNSAAGTLLNLQTTASSQSWISLVNNADVGMTVGTNENEVFSGSSDAVANIAYSLKTNNINRITVAGNGANVKINIGTPSTSTTTGALIVDGGVGVAGNVSATNLTGTLLTASQTNITGLGTITTGTWSADTIAVNKGGTGATTTSGVGGALDNLLPSGEQTGYVLSTSGAGTYSWVAPSAGGTTVGQSLTTLRQSNTATAGQTVFTLVSGTTYTPGAGQLRVYINGVRQFPTEYTETSTTVYTMTSGVSAGDIVFAEIDRASSFNNYANLTYASNVGNISAVGLTTQAAIESLENNKAPLASPVFTGNVTGPNLISSFGLWGTVRTAAQTNITSVGTLGALSVTGNVTVSANVKFAGWQIYETGTSLYFAYNGAVKMSLNTAGNLTVSGDIAGFGTP